jgi:hypothetical protein
MTEQAWTGCPMAENSGRRGFDPAPFRDTLLLVNGVSISLNYVTAYSIPDGWIDYSVPDEAGKIQTTDDHSGIVYLRLEGRIEFRPKPA